VEDMLFVSFFPHRGFGVLVFWRKWWHHVVTKNIKTTHCACIFNDLLIKATFSVKLHEPRATCPTLMS
jgi:hypothetical protein